SLAAQRPPTLGWRCVVSAVPAVRRAGVLFRLFERIRLQGEYPRELRLLARRARVFTPTVADKVAVLARSNPDAAIEAFVSAFQRQHFELDESAFDQGFEFWAAVATDFIPRLRRGTAA